MLCHNPASDAKYGILSTLLCHNNVVSQPCIRRKVWDFINIVIINNVVSQPASDAKYGILSTMLCHNPASDAKYGILSTLQRYQHCNVVSQPCIRRKVWDFINIVWHNVVSQPCIRRKVWDFINIVWHNVVSQPCIRRKVWDFINNATGGGGRWSHFLNRKQKVREKMFWSKLKLGLTQI